MLFLLLIIPVFGAIAVLSAKEGTTAKQAGLWAGVINLVVSLLLLSQFDGNTGHLQFAQSCGYFGLCHLHIGLDGFSLFFVILTSFIIPSCILASWDTILSRPGWKSFLIALLVLETLLIALFVVVDLLLFYICFESVLIPLFFMIGQWGHGASRIRSAFLLFLYTLFGSLFMLLAIITIWLSSGTSDILLLSTVDISHSVQNLLWLGFFLAFAIKLPLVPFHIWLPQAHTDAPLAGSMLLAGIILKLPVYGSLRILLPLLPEASQHFSPLVYTLCIISILYTCLSTLRQSNLKSIIAYSSVSHMAIVTMGLFSNTIQGIEGGIFLSLAHGIVSPALFICITVLYDRWHTLTLLYYRGLAQAMPIFATLFFIFILANMATPPSVNFVGEFLSFIGAFQRNPVLTALAAFFSVILTAAYSIWLFNRVCFGSFSPYLLRASDLTRREFFLLLPYLILTFLLGIFPNLILDYLQFPVSGLIVKTAC
jgi:NADH-ubiquinone oxidoreductase chain 4